MKESGYEKYSADQLRSMLHQRDRYEELLAGITVHFVAPENLNQAMNYALQKILEFSGADRAIIMQVNPDNPEYITMTHEVCREDVQPVKEFVRDIPYTENRWFRKMHRKYGYIAIPDTSKIPSEAIEEKALFTKNKIGASVLTSFTSAKQFRGNLGIHCRKPVERWSREIINLMLHVAVLIEHTLKRWEAEKNLLEAKLRAEQSDKLKSNFLANLSHEIRTPLNGIVGFSKLLAMRQIPEEKINEYYRIIQHNSKQLLSVINDLIDLARIESKSIALQKETFRISVLVNTLYTQYVNSSALHKEVEFSLNLSEKTLPLEVKTDPLRIGQIVEQFIRNAIKYTQSGKITLGTRKLRNQIEVYVQDSGIGISAKNLPRIFERFWHSDSHSVRPYSGNGLGLSLARDFANMLKCEIKVTSKEGKGSRFALLIPYENIKTRLRNTVLKKES